MPCVPGKTRCEKHLKNEAEKAKAIQVRRKAKGLCAWNGCDKQVETGYGRCKEHCEIINSRLKEKQERRKQEGKCQNCGRFEGISSINRQKVFLCPVCYLKQESALHLGTNKRWRELGQLFLKQPYCPYTGIKLTLAVNTSLDHITPTSRGGSKEVVNLQWVYYSGFVDINSMKGQMTDEEFRKVILRLAEHLSK